jgi:ribosome-associated protein
MNIDVTKELEFKTSRSGGKGGQNVNKVETQVEVRFNIASSFILSQDQKKLLLQKLARQLNKNNELLVVCNEDRTQLGNKSKAIKKINQLIEKNLVVPKKRSATKIPQSIKEKRLKSKKIIGALKHLRRGKNFNFDE